MADSQLQVWKNTGHAGLDVFLVEGSHHWTLEAPQMEEGGAETDSYQQQEEEEEFLEEILLEEGEGGSKKEGLEGDVHEDSKGGRAASPTAADIPIHGGVWRHAPSHPSRTRTAAPDHPRSSGRKYCWECGGQDHLSKDCRKERPSRSPRRRETKNRQNFRRGSDRRGSR